MLIDLDQESRRTNVARRKAVLFGLLLALASLGMMTGTVFSLIEFSHERKFATDSATGEANILEHFMIEQTPWLEVEFTDPAGRTHHRTTMMETGPWEQLAKAKTVPIKFVRSNPSLFRLASGELHVDFSKFWIIGAIGSLIFAAATVFALLGYGFGTEPEFIQITRWGRPLNDKAVSAFIALAFFLDGAYISSLC
jgi:hypothetical protein